MKLSLDELPAQLAQRLLPAYLICGDEPLRVAEASDQIRARARAAGYGEREVFFIERASSVWDQALQSAQSLSLFSNRRVIEIRMPTGKPGVSGAAALLRLIAAAGDELLLLVITDKLERDTQGAQWVRALQTRGAWLPLWPIGRAQLPQWLDMRFRAAGLRAHPEAIELLAERSEGNLLAAQQEIDKLALLLSPGALVGVAEVATSSADSTRFDVFQLSEAVRAVEAGRSLRILAGLQAEGTEAPLVLWSLVRTLHGMQANGPGPAGRTAPQLSFARLSARAARADRMAKGITSGDVWDELAMLAVELCGLRPLPWLRAP